MIVLDKGILQRLPKLFNLDFINIADYNPKKKAGVAALHAGLREWAGDARGVRPCLMRRLI